MNTKIEKVLTQALNLKQNVLLSGKHGVGKTEVVKAIFEKKYGKEGYLYFSAATMDPFVDFVGVPRVVGTEKSGQHLELIKPKYMTAGKVRAIFLDEFNRSHKKVRNAVMELMQFKSINGVPFPHLEVIWAAINPDDAMDTYEVDRIDPAQLDRFQVQIEIPYDVSSQYFKAKYGEQGTRAVAWWKRLTEGAKKLMSPRRLDYAISLLKDGFPVAYVIPKECNPTEFVKAVEARDPMSRLKSEFDHENFDEVRDMLRDQSLFATAKPFICKNYKAFKEHGILTEEHVAVLGMEGEYHDPDHINKFINLFGDKGQDFVNRDLTLENWEENAKEVFNLEIKAHRSPKERDMDLDAQTSFDLMLRALRIHYAK